MYITQVKENAKDWWKYLIGLVIVFACLFIFSIPHDCLQSELKLLQVHWTQRDWEI